MNMDYTYILCIILPTAQLSVHINPIDLTINGIYHKQNRLHSNNYCECVYLSPVAMYFQTIIYYRQHGAIANQILPGSKMIFLEARNC